MTRIIQNRNVMVAFYKTLGFNYFQAEKLAGQYFCHRDEFKRANTQLALNRRMNGE